MTDLHILSDPVTDFWKFHIKGFKNNIFVPLFLQLPEAPLLLPGGGVWEGHQPSAGARSRHPLGAIPSSTHI